MQTRATELGITPTAADWLALLTRVVGHTDVDRMTAADRLAMQTELRRIRDTAASAHAEVQHAD